VPRYPDGMDEAEASRERARTLLASLRQSNVSRAPLEPTVDPLAPERAAAVGERDYDYYTWQPARNMMVNGLPVKDAAALKLNDYGCQRLVEDLGSRLEAAYLGPQTSLAPDALILLRSVVRAAERGVRVDVWPDVWQKNWPVTSEMVALLQRATAAFGLEPEAVPFAGTTLAGYLLARTPIETVSGEADVSRFDVAQSVLNFYPSLRVAQQLASAEALAPGVIDFVHGLALPSDVVTLVENAVSESLFSSELKPPEGPTPAAPPLWPYADRRDSADGEYQGFVVGSGPLSVDNGNFTTDYGNQYRDSFAGNPVGFFGQFASDDNLRTITDYGYELGWLGYNAPPEDIVAFAARRCELDDSHSFMVRKGLYGDALNSQYRTDPCVPALIRLAKAVQGNLDEIFMADRVTTLRQRANELGLNAEVRPPDEKRLAETLKAVAEGAPSARLAALAELTSTAPDAPGLSEVIGGLLPSVAAGTLLPIDAPSEQSSLMAALTKERHPLTVAALAGVFLPPGSLPLNQLRNSMLSQLFTEDMANVAHAWAGGLQGLTPKLKHFVLEPLAQTPPGLWACEARLAVAREAEPWSDLYTFWQKKNPAAILSAMVAFGELTGRVAEVDTFIEQGLQEERIKPGDAASARAHALSLGTASRAQQDVSRAVEALAQADVLTRAAKLHDVVEAVMRQSSQGSPRDLIRLALTELYAKDLATVAALGDVDAASVVEPKAFVDKRTVAQRLGASRPRLDLDALARSQPALAKKLKTLKAQLELQHSAADAEAFEAAVVAAGERWLVNSPVESSLKASLLEHLSTWATAR
jgi:hypothetical protein